MPDRYAQHASGLDAPAIGGFAVTPSDAADLPETTRALYVGAAGTVAAVLASGVTLTFAGVTGGTILPVRASRVLATGTTASAIVGLV